MHSKKLVISIVSHGQGDLIRLLLSDLNTHLINSKYDVDIVVTLNIPEEDHFFHGLTNLSIKVIRNRTQKGFGENNNFAFKTFKSDFFLVLNPDVRINVNLIDPMINSFLPNIAVMAPRVLSATGGVEDNFRKFPTLYRLIKRKFIPSGKLDYSITELNLYEVDWVGGMFMLFHSPKYRYIKGFDEKYFMYLEDADICKRLSSKGFSVIYNPSYEIVHNARRNSRRKIQHLLWHLRSMARFLFKI